MNLENFPTSPAAKRMLKTVSPIYDKSYVAKWIFQVMGLEIDEAWKFFEELRLQAFPETATWGIQYWEQRYHIPSDESLSLEERRQRVIIKRGKRAPMNPAKIEQFVQDITGRPVEARHIEGTYIFWVLISPGESNINFQSIVEAIKRVKPSHLAFEVVFESKAVVNVSTASYRFDFPYRLCGTFYAGDDERWSGRLLKSGIAVVPRVLYGTVNYPLCGTFYAGGEQI